MISMLFCGKMHEYGLIEIIPLIYIFTIQSQYSVSFHPESPQGESWQEGWGCSDWWLDGGNISCLPEWQTAFFVYWNGKQCIFCLQIKWSNQVLVSFWDRGPSSAKIENLVWFLWVLSLCWSSGKNGMKAEKTRVVVQFLSCVWLYDLIDCSIPSFPVLYCLPEFAQVPVLSCWCYLTISLAASLFFCFQFFPALGYLLVSWLFASGGQSFGASASVLPVNNQGWFPLGLTGLISLQSRGLSRVFSSTDPHINVISGNLTLGIIYQFWVILESQWRGIKSSLLSKDGIYHEHYCGAEKSCFP